MAAKKKTKPASVGLPDSPPALPASAFPIVGIGASAGGLAAFEAFFSAVPTDTDPGMAFVLVQHLAPDHKSILSDLIKRYTRMEVFEVEDGMVVQPNCAYIIPPNRDMACLNGTLQLLEPAAPRGLRLPIDFFFCSLAQDQHDRAICVVLSGTGSDGTQGLRAVKSEGGMVMAQNPESTEYDGMPRNAIATGLVDFVLPPAEMPAQLLAYAAHAFGRTPRPASLPTSKAEDALKKIFVLLRAHTRHDFSQYKQNTIIRRVERRMAIHQVERLDEYIRYLQQNPGEVESLFRDLLIGVTNFFRDREAFAALEEQVIPRIFAGKPAGATIRAWVPGCSTGEEAYSVAILLQERLDALKQNFQVLVFATDIDKQAIEQARTGIYPASIASDISPERLARFFTQEPGDTNGKPNAYHIQKRIRDLLVFSEQDMIQDPPFSKLDLISCRNLLIYLGGELQKKLIPLFHYALSPTGFLFLGTSESVGEFADLFAALDRKAKLYERKPEEYGAPRPAIKKLLPTTTEEKPALRTPGRPPADSEFQLRELVERALLQQYGVAAALVDERGEIIYLHGRTGQYLEPAPGEAALNILKMAREGLQHELANALREARADQTVAHRSGLRVKTNGDFTTVNLTVRSLSASPFDRPSASSSASRPGMQPGLHSKASATTAGETNLYLVILEEAPAADNKFPLSLPMGKTEDESHTDSEAHLTSLKQELRIKEEYLQTTIEELETSNEELKSSNEEMQSVNEELQSTNEELETSKEELQSVNEELATVNAELQQKVAELSRANNDMSNLLAGTGIGTIFVDQHLCIQRFTPAVTQVINLIPSDVGRPVGHIVSNLVGYDRLIADVQAVLDTLAPREVEVQTQAGAWFLMRIRPYRTLENVIEGAVITFTEITEIKKAQAALQESEGLHRLAVVVRDARDAIIMLDLQGHILAWNPAAEKLYGWNEAEALAMNMGDLIPNTHRNKMLALLQAPGRAKALEPSRSQRVTKDGRVIDIWLIATALTNQAGEVYAISTTEREARLEE